jgi:hypothetical protein
MSNPLLKKNYTAGGAIAPYRIVRFSAADTVVQAAAANDAAIGVSDSIAVVSGERVDVQLVGVGEVEAGAAITVGVLLMSDAQGRAIPAAAAAGVNVRVVGVALEPAVAAGDVIRFQQSPGAFQG